MKVLKVLILKQMDKGIVETEADIQMATEMQLITFRSKIEEFLDQI